MDKAIPRDGAIVCHVLVLPFPTEIKAALIVLNKRQKDTRYERHF